MEYFRKAAALAHHPSDENLRAFLAGPRSLDPLLRRRVVRHLLEECRPCRERLNALDPSGVWRPEPRPAPEDMSRGGEIDYDDVLARAEQTFSLFFAAGRPVQEPPGELLAELAPVAALDGMEETGRRSARRAIPILVKWLSARSHAARYEEPKEMLHWGLMARLAADSCSLEAAGGKRRLADLRARAWGQFGTALRVCGRFREAVEVLASTREYLEAGTGDLALHARFCQQMASLYINQKSLGSAKDLIEEAAEIYEEIGDTQRLASTLVQKAVTLQYQGEPEAVIRLLDRALALLDPIAHPDLVLVARLNRALACVTIDRSDRVLSAFRATRNADRGHRRPALMLRIRWQEAQLLSEIGHLEAAEVMLCSARRGFLEKDLVPEVVAASRDLAGLYRKMGKRSKLEQIVLETQALFFGVPAEAEVLTSLRELERMAAA
jgi:tetratricopeptide (TPR) repeat protein